MRGWHNPRLLALRLSAYWLTHWLTHTGSHLGPGNTLVSPRERPRPIRGVCKINAPSFTLSSAPGLGRKSLLNPQAPVRNWSMCRFISVCIFPSQNDFKALPLGVIKRATRRQASERDGNTEGCLGRDTHAAWERGRWLKP